MTQRNTAWLGIAVKSSTPRASDCQRSLGMIRRIAGRSGLTLAPTRICDEVMARTSLNFLVHRVAATAGAAKRARVFSSPILPPRLRRRYDAMARSRDCFLHNAVRVFLLCAAA